MEGIWTHRKYLGILLNRDGHVESQARSRLIMKEALLLPKHMLNRLLLRKKTTQKKEGDGSLGTSTWRYEQAQKRPLKEDTIIEQPSKKRGSSKK